MKVAIIAGVGDHTRYIQKRTQDWSDKYGIEPVILRFGWRGDYDENYKALKEKILSLDNGENVAVIGISAGGSAALRLANEIPNVQKVVMICSRTSRGGFRLFSLSSFPAYWKSVDKLREVQYQGEVMVIKPLFDEIVSTDHMDYEDAKVLHVPYVFHIPSVLRILSANSDDIADFIHSPISK